VDLSIVVIAYNEQECLRQVVEELLEHMAGTAVQSELLLVDDGSRDATASIMRELAAEHGNSERADSAIVRPLLLPHNLGIGGALRSGFDASQGKWVTWLPADGQIPPEVVTQLYARRHVAPMLTTVYRSRADHPLRTVISRSLNALIKLRTGQAAKSGGNYLFERSLWTQYAPREDDSMMISTACSQPPATGGRAHRGGRDRLPSAPGGRLEGAESPRDLAHVRGLGKAPA
jgi:glycosyltransferase involved in cell wall biosynthesis